VLVISNIINGSYQGMTKWQMEGFEPAYGLNGEVADSILDWVGITRSPPPTHTQERRMSTIAASHFRYIDPMGSTATDVPPPWYVGS
jgi:hypothetical protein